MSNSDMPINPIPGGGAISNGLTKRELLAAMAMQGFAASNSDFPVTYADMANESVKWSDALLKALESEG